MCDDRTLPLALRRRAMDLLARREHCRFELMDKLAKRFPDAGSTLIEQVLDQLEADHLLSDERFVESWARSRISRGYGPLYISYQLRQRGIDVALIDAYLPADDEFWIEQLDTLLRRKYDDAVLKSNQGRDLQRVQRYILSKGFTHGHWSRWRRS